MVSQQPDGRKTTAREIVREYSMLAREDSELFMACQHFLSERQFVFQMLNP